MNKAKGTEDSLRTSGISMSSPFRLHEIAFICLHKFQKGSILTTNAKTQLSPQNKRRWSIVRQTQVTIDQENEFRFPRMAPYQGHGYMDLL